MADSKILATIEDQIQNNYKFLLVNIKVEVILI